MASNYDFEKFKTAQIQTLERAENELKNGCKTSHWIWWIFPQLKDLGHSSTSKNYGISSREEASAYMNDEILRNNYIKYCQALLYFHRQNSAKNISEIMRFPDDKKLKSSLTLFLNSTDNEELKKTIKEILDIYYNGEQDRITLNLLNL